MGLSFRNGNSAGTWLMGMDRGRGRERKRGARFSISVPWAGIPESFFDSCVVTLHSDGSKQMDILPTKMQPLFGLDLKLLY